MRNFFRRLMGAPEANQDKTLGTPTAANAQKDKNGLIPIGEYPWKGHHDYAACNFALGHLVHNLLGRMTIDGRIHAETCVAGIGAVAGFAAQRALFAQIAASDDKSLLSQIHTASTKSGANYFFGDPLNNMLMPVTEADALSKIWSHAAGAVVEAGVDPSRLPKLGDMFGHVAASIGGENEGWPTVDRKHYPHMQVRDLLKVLWPTALTCFSGRFPDSEREYGAASIHFWPAIAAYAAGGIMNKVQGVLDPSTSLVIVMESAIYASKLDPASVAGPSP